VCGVSKVGEKKKLYLRFGRGMEIRRENEETGGKKQRKGKMERKLGKRWRDRASGGFEC
jgi:hypothetical protein